MNQVLEAVGRALLRAPYAWLTTTLLLYCMMLSVEARVPDEGAERSTVITVAAAVLLASHVVMTLAVHPGVLEQARGQRSAGMAASLRWAFAAAPFPAMQAAARAGGQRWLLSVGLLTSVVLLVRAARALRREGESQPDTGRTTR